MTSHHRYSKYFPFIFIAADLLCLNIGVLVANYSRFDSFIPSDEYRIVQLILNVIWIIIFFGSKLHEINHDSRLIDHLNRVLTGLVIKLSIVFAFWFILQPIESSNEVSLLYSRKFLFVAYVVFSALILVWRVGWHYVIGYYRSKGFNIRNVIIIGKGALSDSLAKYFNSESRLGYQLIDTIDIDPSVKISFQSLEEQIALDKTDIIFCCLPYLTDNQAKEVIDFAENNLIRVNLISQFSMLGSYNLSLEQFDNIPVIKVNTTPLDRPINKLMKRAFDIVFSSFLLVFFLSWMIPLIGLMIKLESKGPIFFRQKRHGRDNKDFTCLKFRTMSFHKKAKFVQATKNDKRVTRIGSILRKTSIDELPQLMNVLFGEMSIVGPRPHPIELNVEYQPQIDRFWQRHAVRPGITGLAQAKGFRGETVDIRDMSGRIKLDRFYVKNWSLFLDFKIIFLTTVAILKGDQKAY